MSLTLPILLGLETESNLNGIKINFNNQASGVNVFGNTLFAKATGFLLGQPIVKIATFGYLHVFIHEMGHALAAQLCGDPSPSINVYTSTCRGDTRFSEGAKFSRSQRLFITLTGPILSTIWEIVKLISAIGLAILLPSPIGSTLGLFIGVGSAFWIFGEVAYACSKNGDWSFLNHL